MPLCSAEEVCPEGDLGERAAGSQDLVGRVCQATKVLSANSVKAKIERCVAELTGEKIDAGRTDVKNFLQRGLSMRFAHVQRRAEPDDEKASQFIEGNISM